MDGNGYGKLKISVVVPFFNEEECVEQVSREIMDVLEADFHDQYEFIAVNDGSNDDTGGLLEKVSKENEHMLVIHGRERLGQSAALKLGFMSARGDAVGTLDGDGQSDPGDLAKLLAVMDRTGADMVSGIRVKRRDNWVRRASSRIANRVRSSILKDSTSDVGCAVRVFRRNCLDRVYLFRNFHRFFPALFVMNGFTVMETPVNHRQRLSGTSKYGGGIRSRLWVGLADLAGVYWLSKRVINPGETKTEENKFDG